jgi:hypothetical protein
MSETLHIFDNDWPLLLLCLMKYMPQDTSDEVFDKWIDSDYESLKPWEIGKKVIETLTREEINNAHMCLSKVLFQNYQHYIYINSGPIAKSIVAGVIYYILTSQPDSLDKTKYYLHILDEVVSKLKRKGYNYLHFMIRDDIFEKVMLFPNKEVILWLLSEDNIIHWPQDSRDQLIRIIRMFEITPETYQHSHPGVKTPVFRLHQLAVLRESTIVLFPVLGELTKYLGNTDK